MSLVFFSNSLWGIWGEMSQLHARGNLTPAASRKKTPAISAWLSRCWSTSD